MITVRKPSICLASAVEICDAMCPSPSKHEIQRCVCAKCIGRTPGSFHPRTNEGLSKNLACAKEQLDDNAGQRNL
jgi:hypothetical protein